MGVPPCSSLFLLLVRSGWLALRFHDTWTSGDGGDPFWIINAIVNVRFPRPRPEGAAARQPQALPAPALKPYLREPR